MKLLPMFILSVILLSHNYSFAGEINQSKQGNSINKDLEEIKIFQETYKREYKATEQLDSLYDVLNKFSCTGPNCSELVNQASTVMSLAIHEIDSLISSTSVVSSNLGNEAKLIVQRLCSVSVEHFSSYELVREYNENATKLMNRLVILQENSKIDDGLRCDFELKY